ncbi:MAG TPA: hypothetical protein VKE40_20485 [Gemmataceae bacterium]|nr:hypothetical protein [Gemmataceae bacterium]
MGRYISVLAVVAVALAGCADNSPPPAGPNPEPGGSVEQTPANLLEPLVMSQKPAKAASVRDVMAMKDGEKVVVSGRTPTEKVKPFNAAVAAFVLMSPEDMDRDEVKEEFDCDDAATCPACKQILEKYAVRVELVDQSGVVVPASLDGFRGIKPGGSITVEGEVKRDGKDKKTVRVVAKKFYPG